MWTTVDRRCFMKLTTKTFLLDDENEGASDDSDDKVGEVRFVPEDKSACKIQKFILDQEETWNISYLNLWVPTSDADEGV